MTTLFSWTGIDTHGPASIYIASDSRISWGPEHTWDVGNKLFASKLYPELFGYCGSVTFPIQILGQLVEHIDNNLLFDQRGPLTEKIEKVRLNIENSYFSLPKEHQRESQILYATRIGERMQSTFHAAKISICPKGVIAEEVRLPDQSGIIASAGSGKSALNAWHEEWIGKPSNDPYGAGRTSRNVFSSFCDSLKSRQDIFSGGSPQLIGLYRIGPAKQFGVIFENKRYLSGIEVPEAANFNSIEWRNELFERCCGVSMKILQKAQKQPKLPGIKAP